MDLWTPSPTSSPSSSITRVSYASNTNRRSVFVCHNFPMRPALILLAVVGLALASLSEEERKSMVRSPGPRPEIKVCMHCGALTKQFSPSGIEDLLVSCITEMKSSHHLNFPSVWLDHAFLLWLSGEDSASGTLTASPSVISQSGDTVTVSWSGVEGVTNTSQDWIGVFPASAPTSTDYFDYQWASTVRRCLRFHR